MHNNRRRYSKESIKDRMYRNAVSFWDVQNVENLDPIVKLLIEALANQVYGLANDFKNIEIRLLEKIAHLLTPDILNAARPAHMIMKAKPIEPQYMLSKMSGFYYDDPVFNIRNVMNACFSPANSFLLTRGDIRSVISGGNVYVFDERMGKDTVARSNERTDIFERNIWVGLDLDEEIKTMQNLSFYFNFLNTDKANEYIHLLPFTEWSCADVPFDIKEGIYIADADTGEKDSLFTKYDLSGISDESILNFYNHQFISIKNDVQIKSLKKEHFPSDLKSLFPEGAEEHIEKPLLWIKIAFPPNFNEDILDNVLVAINAFPVLNKKMLEKHVKTNGLKSVIPLNTAPHEYFLSVHSLTDSLNVQYEQLPYVESEKPYAGTYSVKRGGVERFDSRDAKEYILNLIDLLREEGAAFSLIGKGFLTELIKQVESSTNIIDQKLLEINENKEIPAYLIVDTEEKENTFFVDYWVTNCDLANGIKTGAFFKPYNKTFVEANLIFSLTPSVGGQKAPKSNYMLDRYKYILMSRDRIYTQTDIVNFCFSEFGEIINDAEVKRGVQISYRPKEGFIRTLDVFLQLKQSYEHLINDQNFESKVLNLLIEKSPDTFNYRVFINKIGK